MSSRGFYNFTIPLLCSQEVFLRHPSPQQEKPLKLRETKGKIDAIHGEFGFGTHLSCYKTGHKLQVLIFMTHIFRAQEDGVICGHYPLADELLDLLDCKSAADGETAGMESLLSNKSVE